MVLGVVLASLVIPTCCAHSQETPKNSRPTLVGTPVQATEQTPASGTSAGLGGSLRILKLLWNGNPESAARSLQRTLELALARGQVETLAGQLAQMSSIFEAAANKDDDPRRPVAVAALVIVNSQNTEAKSVHLTALKSMVELRGNNDTRGLLMRVWFHADRESAFQHFQQVLSKDSVEVDWLQVAITQAFDADRTRASRLVLAEWNRLPREVRVSCIEPLTHQADTMMLLIHEIRDGRIAKDLVNTNQLRKWLATDQQALAKQIEETWGQIRASDNAQRQELVSRTIAQLRAAPKPGDPHRGLAVFQRVCSQCHVLHGQGFEVGPNITSNGRGNFEQLVSNVLDPSLVIGAAFQARTVLTTDGQVISGLLVAADERRVTLKVQGGKTIELNRDSDIEQMKTSSNSLMPEGLEQQLTFAELADLFALLCHVKPLDDAPIELIPGTPDKLVDSGQ